MTQHNQYAIAAIQSGSASSELLRQQVIEVSKQMEELKLRHK